MSDPFEEYDEYDDVDLDPSNKAPSNRLERFKGEKDRIYRVALLYFHPLEAAVVRAAKSRAKKEGKELDKEAVRAKLKELYAKRAEMFGIQPSELKDWHKLDYSKAQFKKVQTQFGKQPGVGLVVSRKGLDGAEADKAWDLLDPPSTYYYTVILKYPTDRKGDIDAKAVLREAEVLPWRFAGGVFNRLIDINSSLKEVGDGVTLANQDLKLTCKNAQFQNFEIDFAGKAVWTRHDEIRNKFLPLAYAIYDKMVSSDVRELSSADLRDKLNLGSLGGDLGKSDDVGDSEMDDLISNI